MVSDGALCVTLDLKENTNMKLDPEEYEDTEEIPSVEEVIWW